MTSSDAQPSPAPRSSRNRSYDGARALLMALGVVLHAASPYITSGGWIVSDPARSVVFDWVVKLIHSFRIPGFFFVAGILSVGALHRRGARGFLRSRMERLLLPMAVVWLTLNVLQEQFIPGAHSGAFHLPPIGHLWFLMDLSVYTALLVLGRPWIERWVDAVQAWQLRPAHLLALLVAISLAGHASGYALGSLGWLRNPFWNWGELLSMAGFYFAGFALQRMGQVEAFLRLGSHLKLLPLALLAAWAMQHVTGAAADLLELLVRWAVTITVIGWLLQALAGCSGRLAPLIRFNYTLYLFHHIVVVAVAVALMPMAWPLPAKFTAVALLAVVVPLAVHVLVVERFAWARLLFNGERMAR